MPPRRLHSHSKNKDGEDSVMTDLDPTGNPSHGACAGVGSVEAMVVVKGRWGDDEEVSMDVDVTEEDERGFLSEISLTRGAVQYLAMPSFLPDGSISMSAAFSQPERLYIVLDTNVLLAHLQFLMELKDCAIKGVGRPVLVVPWVVMQELDALKASSNGRVSTAARAAITSLHDCFTSGHPRVRGQTMDEVHTEVDNVAIDSNDDKILHCCLLYKTKVRGHKGQVVLFSNDIQLCSKAMVNQLPALSRKTLLAELRVLCRAMHKATPTSSAVSSHNKDVIPQVDTMVQEVLLECEHILQATLSVVVQVEMELAFDTLWTSVVVVKPPWALTDLLHILDKHWIAVFGLVMHVSYRPSNLQPLTMHIKSKDKTVRQWSDVEAFVSSSVRLLKACPQRSRYHDNVRSSMAALQALAARARQGSSATPPVTASSPGNSTYDHTSSQPGHTCTTQLCSSGVQSVHPYSGSPGAGSQTHLQPSMAPGHASTTTDHASMMLLSKEEVGQLTQNIPASPQQQLPWILSIILHTTQQCLSKIAGSLSSSSHEGRERVADVIVRLATVLQCVVTAMIQLVQDLSVSGVRDFRAAVEVFFLTCLQFSCPLSLQALCELVPDHLPLIIQATHEFSSAMDTLRLLAKQDSLPL